MYRFSGQRDGRSGKVLLEGEQPAGTHKVLLHGTGLAAGSYLLVLEADGQRVVRQFLKVE